MILYSFIQIISTAVVVFPVGIQMGDGFLHATWLKSGFLSNGQGSVAVWNVAQSKGRLESDYPEHPNAIMTFETCSDFSKVGSILSGQSMSYFCPDRVRGRRKTFLFFRTTSRSQVSSVDNLSSKRLIALRKASSPVLVLEYICR